MWTSRATSRTSLSFALTSGAMGLFIGFPPGFGVEGFARGHRTVLLEERFRLGSVNPLDRHPIEPTLQPSHDGVLREPVQPRCVQVNEDHESTLQIAAWRSGQEHSKRSEERRVG